MQKLCFLFSLFLLCVQPAFAEADISAATKTQSTKTIELDGTSVSVPAPAGFTTTSDKVPALLTVFRQYFPKDTLLIDVFATEPDIKGLLDGTAPELKKYFVMAQPVEMQNQRFTRADLAGIADILKQQGKTLFEDKVKSTIESNVEKGNASLSELADEKVELKLGKLGFLGVFGTTENTVLFSIRAEVSTDENRQKETVISSSVFLLLGDKIVMLAAYAGEHDRKTDVSGISWTQAEVVKWADAILKANTVPTKVN